MADPDRRRRFVLEALAASALSHPDIVTIYDDEAEGVHLIAMEYVDGKTLDQLIPRHGMRLSEALKMAVQMADALAAAHEAGIVHRDLKPGNLMVTDKGQWPTLTPANLPTSGCRSCPSLSGTNRFLGRARDPG